MRLTATPLLAAAIYLAALPVSAQAALHGKATHQIPGSVGHLPETRSLEGATIIIGINLQVEVGQTGTDTVVGKVVAKGVSGSDGTFTLSAPAGTYTILCWKEGFVPMTESGVSIPGTFNPDLGKDTSGRSLHRTLSFGK